MIKEIFPRMATWERPICSTDYSIRSCVCRKNIDQPQISMSASLSILQIVLAVSEILEISPVIVVPLLPLDHSGQLPPWPKEKVVVTWP